MKIYLELTDDKSEKFWEIEQTGNSHTVRYGKIGAKGTSKTKEFESAEKAETDANKLIKAKQKKGYAEAIPDNTTPAKSTPKAVTTQNVNNPQPQIMSYDALRKQHRIDIGGNDFSKVLYYNGDLVLNEDLTQNWQVLEELGLGSEDLLIYINGNLTVNGELSPAFDVSYPCLYVNGNVKCDELISGDGYICITGDATIKYILNGNYNDGHIEIHGTTYVPYILNSDHSTDVNPATGTLTLCYHGDDQMMDYDFVEDDFPRIMKKSVMKGDEFQYDKFVELVRKGTSPLKKGAKTKKQVLQEELLKLLIDPDAVTEIDLSDRGLEEFPEQLLQLKNLKVLNLNDNSELREIPKEIIALQNLEELYIQYGDTRLPEEIAKLPKLRILDLYFNDAILPENIGDLTNLEVLKCQFDAEYFPESIKNLRSLTHLNITRYNERYNQKKVSADFPEQICELEQLKHLELDRVRFLSFPKGINKLINLEILECTRSFQAVQEIPKITELKKLKEAYLGDAFGNPACIQTFFNIPTLTFLSVDRYKKLEPKHLEGINKLVNLERLNISFNELTTLHEDVYKLERLKHLNVNYSRLNYDTLSKLVTTYPNASFVVYPVDEPDKSQRKEYNHLRDVNRKFWRLHKSINETTKENKMHYLNQLFELGDYVYGELVPEGAPKYEFFSTLGSCAISVLKHVGNEIAWHASKFETDPERIEKAIKYIERSLAEISPTGDDFIRDSYVRILLKAGRTDDAYEVAHEVLSRKPHFSDLSDLKKNKAYLSWVKENK